MAHCGGENDFYLSCSPSPINFVCIERKGFLKEKPKNRTPICGL